LLGLGDLRLQARAVCTASISLRERLSGEIPPTYKQAVVHYHPDKVVDKADTREKKL